MTAPASARISAARDLALIWRSCAGRRTRRELRPEPGVDEGIEVAVEHGVGVPHLGTGAQVLHHPVGMQDVRADLVAEADVGLALRHRGHLLLMLALLELVEPRL